MRPILETGTLWTPGSSLSSRSSVTIHANQRGRPLPRVGVSCLSCPFLLVQESEFKIAFYGVPLGCSYAQKTNGWPE